MAVRHSRDMLALKKSRPKFFDGFGMYGTRPLSLLADRPYALFKKEALIKSPMRRSGPPGRARDRARFRPS
ncbi:hypothetical protein sS8_0115 [Methylocaldum marinum]|uniref:Uncharacterized protein n=1 Tax=Methylocaldum marinum TaxID=1432792 RepID=A0A286P362_9GAMM|nr:hypothetical protein sS8_0115 [Methylocaldum marinum]